MKKSLLTIVVILFSASVLSQITTSKSKRSSFTVSAGVSIPVVCYASKNMGNEEAGFAKIGFNVNLVYEFNFIKNAGLATRLFYSFNEVDKKIDPENSLSSISNYKYSGLMIGPYFTHSAGSNLDLSIKFLPGFIHVNSPTLAYSGNAVRSDKGAFAFAWSAATDIRYHLKGRNSFILMNGDFTSSKPRIEVPAPGENVKIEQHIAVVNVNTGFGFRF